MDGRARVLRGGSWNNNESRNLLSSNRNNNDPDNRNDNNGFRVVVSVRKAVCGVMRNGIGLFRRCREETSLIHVPVPRSGKIGEKTRRRNGTGSRHQPANVPFRHFLIWKRNRTPARESPANRRTRFSRKGVVESGMQNT